ncbi:MAG: hypothetical protein IPN13_25040 [Bacteroidetes bacterium]|nr:hypothetical protein [Bacteroidota bacterium]
MVASREELDLVFVTRLLSVLIACPAFFIDVDGNKVCQYSGKPSAKQSARISCMSTYF